MSDAPLWSEAAEQAVLGAVLIKPALLGQVAGMVRVDDFFLPAHREIYEALLELRRRKVEPDAVTAFEEMERRGTTGRLDGGISYLLTLANAVPYADNVAHYARIVSSHAAIRTLERVLASTRESARVDPETASEHLREASRLIIRVCVGQSGEAERVGVTAERIKDEIERACKGEVTPRVPTGIIGLDNRLRGGLRAGLCVPMGLTGMGKSSFAFQVGWRAADAGVPVLIVSCEMEREDVVRKGAAVLSRTPTDELEPAPRDLATWKRIHKTLARATDLEDLVRIETFRGLGQIAATAAAWRAENPGPRALIVVDHAQKVEARMTRKNGTREQEVAFVAATLQNLALDLKVPLILPAQMANGASEENRPPRLGDARESKAIEHEAVTVIGIHRDRGLPKGPAELIVLKARYGQPGPVMVEWNGDYQGFENEGYETEYQERRFADG